MRDTTFESGTFNDTVVPLVKICVSSVSIDVTGAQNYGTNPATHIKIQGICVATGRLTTSLKTFLPNAH